jgi:hypothetical protein
MTIRDWECFQCEKCNSRIFMSPDLPDNITCAKCGYIYRLAEIRRRHEPRGIVRVKRLSQATTVKERLEEFKNDLPEPPIFDCNCVECYRSILRFRQAVFELYSEDRLTQNKALALLVSFNYSRRNEFREAVKLTRQIADSHVLADNRELKRGRGRPPRRENLALVLDAIVLSLCPNGNGYVHLLRDALTLRAKEYCAEENSHLADRVRWAKFHRVRRAAEDQCKRIWKIAINKEPPQPSEDWWRGVAAQQGMLS